MRAIGIRLVLLALFVSGCVSSKEWAATGGSRSDGVVRLSYEVGNFERVELDEQQAIALASRRCSTWGYAGAEAFGGTTRHCNLHGGLGGCARWLVTKEYQCTGTGSGTGPVPATPASIVPAPPPSSVLPTPSTATPSPAPPPPTTTAAIPPSSETRALDMRAWAPGTWRSTGGTNTLTIKPDLSWQWSSTSGGSWSGSGQGEIRDGRLVLRGWHSSSIPMMIRLSREGEVLVGELQTSRSYSITFRRD